MSNKICAGIIAQVDAGKTTLCESILYSANVIRKKGRVDSGNTFFDYNDSEIQHGITVFSKEASFNWKCSQISIIDTPGHHDFKSEVDRVLPVIDILVFILSASEITKPNNIYLFRQIEKYNKPIIVFLSKMDMGRVSEPEAAALLQSLYSDKCILYINKSLERETAATIDDCFFNAYLENTVVPQKHICESINNRVVYPVIPGSGLKGNGVEELLDLLSDFAAINSDFNSEPGNKKAYIYKIDRDSKGYRQAHVKILAGTFSVRDEIEIIHSGTACRQKINEIRSFNGSRFCNLAVAEQGDIAVFTGITVGMPGDCIGTDAGESGALYAMQNGIEYTIFCPDSISQSSFLNAIHLLEEEDPSLAFSVSEYPVHCIKIHLHGELQKEIIHDTFLKRFNIPVTFGQPCVDYYETITDTVYGSGHYEPLKHYAEVRVELAALPRGSGIIIDSKCPTNQLDVNWQNVILNSLQSFRIRGILTGSPITDIRISLISGRYHVKHTEGGDFREAAIRAVRQGLMKANSTLLEPYVSFIIICNANASGQIVSGFQTEHLTIKEQFINENSMFEIHGSGPLIHVDSVRKQYLIEFGDSIVFEYRPEGYAPCAESDKIIKSICYDPQSDLSQSPDSVFCFHGAGHIIKWNEADQYMHTDIKEFKPFMPGSRYVITEDEINEILRRNSLLDPIPAVYHKKEPAIVENAQYKNSPVLYLIDGSNLLFAFSENKDNWQQDREENINVFKDRLITDLINYLQYTGSSAEIVFDGCSPSSQTTYDDKIDKILSVTYSGNESADVIIERLAASIGPDFRCKMVTSDRLMQISALNSGIVRISSREFLDEIHHELEKMRKIIKECSIQSIAVIGDLPNGVK